MNEPTAIDIDPNRKSLEEEDHLICSTKKIKSKETMGENDMDISTEIPPLNQVQQPSLTPVETPQIATHEEGPKPKSFKEALATNKSQDFYFDEAMDEESADEEEEEGNTTIQDNDSTQTHNGIPRIRLPKKLLQQIHQAWANTLIVRLLGKSIGYKMLCTRVRNLWGLQDDFNVIDLGNNYFLFKFTSQEDCSRVYSGGPWVIMNHYLTVRKWEPDFKASEAFETTTAVGVRFPKLPIEYFQEKVLYAIAKQIGRPLKIDLTTAMVTRGKFARVCIEIDLRKPLCPRFMLGMKYYNIEYESIHSFYFHCGRVDHRKELCKHPATNSKAPKTQRTNTPPD
ncbi:hypothetical protein ACSBR2_030743 [Camellia fascicularis]